MYKKGVIMKAARIIIGWMDKVYSGDDASEIIKQVEKVQEFDCLISMGRSMGELSEQNEINKLEQFVSLYRTGELTMQDIKKLDIKLSVGNIKCTGVAESEDEISKL